MNNFRFNFSDKEDCDEIPSEASDNVESIRWAESEEVRPEKILKTFDDENVRAKMFVCGEVEIGHLVTSTALANITKYDKTVELAEIVHSDLITGIYEGGLKIWECTYDLIQFLEEQSGINFEDKAVLDLGCGAGILGIYALHKAALVTFQDYNKEVLEYFTIPNVLINMEEEEEKEKVLKRCKFYSGDWQSFNNILPEMELYDIILTSETIYNEINYDKLINLFVTRLKKGGLIYIAAKTYYFGVGGGIRQFEQTVQKNGLLKSASCWKSTSGLQREILKINFS